MKKTTENSLWSKRFLLSLNLH